MNHNEIKWGASSDGEFRMGKYRDGDHRQGVPCFSFNVIIEIIFQRARPGSTPSMNTVPKRTTIAQNFAVRSNIFTFPFSW